METPRAQGVMDLQARTKAFALRVMKVNRALPPSAEGRAIASQSVRASTSVTANYRALCRARSRAELVAKLGVVIEEADETAFRLELLREAELTSAHGLRDITAEAMQLLRIFVASRETANKDVQSKITIGSQKLPKQEGV